MDIYELAKVGEGTQVQAADISETLNPETGQFEYCARGYVSIIAESLVDGIRDSLSILRHGGFIRGKNQDFSEMQRDIVLSMCIKDVDKVRIPMTMVHGLEELVDYVLEMTEGTKDYEADKLDYTYHLLLAPNLDFVIDLLKKDPITRQATLNIANQETAHLPHPPCMQEIQFRVSDRGKLDTHVLIRSNDAYKAATDNMFAVIELARKVARLAGIEKLGMLNWCALSYHCYNKDLFRLEKAVERFFQEPIESLSYSYEEYLEVFNEIADKLRDHYKQEAIKAAINT